MSIRPIPIITRNKLLLCGLALSVISLIGIGIASEKLDFEAANLWLLGGWAGVGIMALAVMGPARYSLRLLFVGTTLIVVLLGVVAALRR